MNKVELELIHREVDGENSLEESVRVHEILAASFEARTLYDELCVVDEGLRNAAMAEPPRWLKSNVMASLPDAKRRIGFRLPAFLRGLGTAMQARPALAYAYTFALGAVFGLGVFAIALQETPADERDLYGALAGEDAAGAEVLPIQLDGFRGKAEISTSGQYIVVDLIVEAEEETDVRMAAGSSLTLRGFARKGSNAATTIDVGSDDIVFGVNGSDRFSIMFSREESNDPHVRLEVRQGGRLLYEEQLRSAQS